MKLSFTCYFFAVLTFFSCRHTAPSNSTANAVKPVVVTEQVPYDTDDPAIWVNKSDPSQSLIIGTDKDENGGIFAFDLHGKIVRTNTIKGVKRPNNIDIAYGLQLGNTSKDIAVATERMTHRLRVFSLPDMKEIGEGLEMFEGETQPGYRDLMGIALYTQPESNDIYAIVGRKNGPLDGGYLGQYLLMADEQGNLTAKLVRKFGKYSGKKEIESIAVDNELGYVYYSDEGVGVRKYYADPTKGNEELALFATTGFTADHEGISIYKINDGTGYILVSDQQANQFHIFPREGTSKNPNEHPLLKVVKFATRESDGSEVTSFALNDQFKSGLFVAMSTDRTFQFYRWEDIAGNDLAIAPNGFRAQQLQTQKP